MDTAVPRAGKFGRKNLSKNFLRANCRGKSYLCAFLSPLRACSTVLSPQGGALTTARPYLSANERFNFNSEEARADLMTEIASRFEPFERDSCQNDSKSLRGRFCAQKLQKGSKLAKALEKVLCALIFLSFASHLRTKKPALVETLILPALSILVFLY